MTHIEKMRLQAALKELQGKQRSITLSLGNTLSALLQETVKRRVRSDTSFAAVLGASLG